jgi:hypothetical protein
MKQLSPLTYQPDCPATIEKYRKKLISNTRNYLLFAIAMLTLFLFLALQNVYLYIFVCMSGLGTILTLWDYIDSLTFKKLTIEKDIFLRIIKNSMLEGVVFELEKAGITAGLSDEKFNGLKNNMEVYLIRAGRNKKLMDIVPVDVSIRNPQTN